jgi:hypothetical protein
MRRKVEGAGFDALNDAGLTAGSTMGRTVLLTAALMAFFLRWIVP